MGLKSEHFEFRCTICGHLKSQIPEKSIALDNFPFFSKENVRICTKCGNLFYFCTKCGSQLFLINYPLDPFSVVSNCEKCKEKNAKLFHWVQKQLDHARNPM